MVRENENKVRKAATQFLGCCFLHFLQKAPVIFAYIVIVKGMKLRYDEFTEKTQQYRRQTNDSKRTCPRITVL